MADSEVAAIGRNEMADFVKIVKNPQPEIAFAGGSGLFGSGRAF